jgi:hypothetical protein
MAQGAAFLESLAYFMSTMRNLYCSIFIIQSCRWLVVDCIVSDSIMVELASTVAESKHHELPDRSAILLHSQVMYF